eukprot:GEMP01063400.1.p1 GENE.GEMP01063400.1~~GEMP01063400.1.p1  ORF type:complete len:201 (+),score=36.59 GEMP01063400.1:426-1028(+)
MTESTLYIYLVTTRECLNTGNQLFLYFFCNYLPNTQVRYNIKFDEKVKKYRAEDVAGGWWERDLERRDRRRDSRSRGHRRRGDSHERRGRRRERSRYRERSRSRRRDRSDDVCRQYQRSGKCEYGEKCKFEHDDPKSREKETKEKVREKLREKSRAKSREKKSRAKSREKKSRSKSRRKSRSKSRSEAPKPGAAFTFDDY